MYLQHVLLYRHCKMKYFENHGGMSGIILKFAPKLDLLKTTVARKKKNFLYWKR